MSIFAPIIMKKIAALFVIFISVIVLGNASFIIISNEKTKSHINGLKKEIADIEKTQEIQAQVRR